MTGIAVIRSAEDWARLQEPWQRLLEEADVRSPFMTWEWLDAWSRQFTDDRELQILVCSDNDEVIAILPLVSTVRRRARVGVTTVKLLGNGLSDRLGLLVRPGREDAMAAVARCLKEGGVDWDILELEDLDCEDPLAKALEAGLRSVGISARFTESVRCPYVTLAADWETFYADRFGKKTRKSNRVKLRKLGAMGDMGLRWVVEPQDVVPALEAIRAMDERRAYHGEERIRPFDSDRGQQFFRDFGTRFAENGWLQLGLFELDGAAVAYSFGFRFKGRHFDYFGGFIPSLFKLSVGRLLMVEIIKHCFEEHVTEVDFLRGLESWKEEWTELNRPNGTLTAYNPSLGSRVRVLLQKIPWFQARCIGL